jgi:hypothetical protein
MKYNTTGVCTELLVKEKVRLLRLPDILSIKLREDRKGVLVKQIFA